MQVVVLKHIPYESDSGYYEPGIPKKRGIPSGGEQKWLPVPEATNKEVEATPPRLLRQKSTDKKKKPYTPEV